MPEAGTVGANIQTPFLCFLEGKGWEKVSHCGHNWGVLGFCFCFGCCLFILTACLGSLADPKLVM